MRTRRPPGWRTTPQPDASDGVHARLPDRQHVSGPRRPEGDPQRDRVVALVERLGGQIERDEKAPGRPVVGIRLATTRISDDQLGELRGLSSLRSLDLTQTRISDAGLAQLRGHEGLRSLDLFETRVTDRGFESIATMSGLETLVVGVMRRDRRWDCLSSNRLNHLKTLSLFGLEVTDETLAPVARLTRLERLDLVDLKITDAGLVHLRGLTRLRQLSLGGNSTMKARSPTPACAASPD